MTTKHVSELHRKLQDVQDKEGRGVVWKVMAGEKDAEVIKAWNQELSGFIEAFMVSPYCHLYVGHSIHHL